MDILPTLARLCGAPPSGAVLDGLDVWPLWAGAREHLDREAFLYFNGWDLLCARIGPWKLHVTRYTRTAWNPDPPGGCQSQPLAKPELYNLEVDPEESYDCSAEHSEIVAPAGALPIRRKV